VTKKGEGGRGPGQGTPNAAALGADTPGADTPGLAAPSAPAPRAHPKDPLHGITLQTVLEELHARYGWAELGRRIPIRCFTHEPSMASSLVFLRRQPWARSQVEDLWLRSKRSRRA
jgi:DNA-binding protein VF530